MAYIVPNLSDLMLKARAAFRANLKGSDATIWPNNIYATGKVMAGQAFEIFGFASYISRQKFAHTAPDLESLALHGEEFGIPRKPAAPANGFVEITSPVAVSFEVSSLLRRSDGFEFRATSGGSLLSAGVLQLAVVATADGADGNTAAGAALEIVSGMTGGENAEAIVAADGISLGLDVEDIESWRSRILFRKRNPPHGGSAADYVGWAGEVSGVSFFSDRPTVYVERRWAGAGTVRVFVLMYDLYEDGIPHPADIDRVADHVRPLEPAGADVTYAAPMGVPVNITIKGLTPDTTATREAVMDELRSAFRRKSRVSGNDVQISNMPYLAYPFAFSRSWIWQAVANASGEESHIITVPAADVVLSTGQKPVLGTVTFEDA